MKLKLRLARWIARRIEKRSRLARRALRDYRRQEEGRIRRDERRTRGLRLYIAWSQPTATRPYRSRIGSREGTIGTLGSIVPVVGHVSQAAH